MHFKGEADSKQWLDRVSLSYEFNNAVSADLGARRVLGTNQPYGFAPYGPSTTSGPLQTRRT
jgi:hypothetical protein